MKKSNKRNQGCIKFSRNLHDLKLAHKLAQKSTGLLPGYELGSSKEADEPQTA